jgi:hypothetical protein
MTAFKSLKVQFHKNPSVSWACVVSILLFLLFCGLQAASSSVLNLPVQWLGIAMLPILLALIVGGYIGKFKAAGIEFEPGMRLLPYAPPSSSPTHTLATHAAPEWPPAEESAPAPIEAPPNSAWQNQRDLEYRRTGYLFLVHVYERSTRPGQLYDITIFLMRHVRGPAPNQKEGFPDVEKAEFYFGESWQHQVFVAHNEGGFIGVRTSAWGTFLATCLVTFKDQHKSPVILHRYIDFEMAPKAA